MVATTHVPLLDWMVLVSRWAYSRKMLGGTPSDEADPVIRTRSVFPSTLYICRSYIQSVKYSVESKLQQHMRLVMHWEPERFLAPNPSRMNYRCKCKTSCEGLSRANLTGKAGTRRPGRSRHTCISSVLDGVGVKMGIQSQNAVRAK